MGPYRFLTDLDHLEDIGITGPQPTRAVERHMLIERDVAIPFHDGVRVYANIFRPMGERQVPALLAWGRTASMRERSSIWSERSRLPVCAKRRWDHTRCPRGRIPILGFHRGVPWST